MTLSKNATTKARKAIRAKGYITPFQKKIYGLYTEGLITEEEAHILIQPRKGRPIGYRDIRIAAVEGDISKYTIQRF